ncbi:MAG TPA: hypothetical protein VFT31_01610 [Kribbella sp.]|nr:hypothetical protein [Kribbella sp.]
MASRLIRGTAIAGGVATVAGLTLGLLAGEPTDPADLPAARKLPSDLCARLGDVSALLPKATDEQLKLLQTGSSVVRCRVDVDEKTQPTHTSASLAVTVTPYGAKEGGAGAPPFPPETVARQAYDRKPANELTDRPYPTKVERSPLGQEHWRMSVLVVRADVLVQVDYTAQPISEDTAEQAALVLADRAILESR